MKNIGNHHKEVIMCGVWLKSIMVSLLLVSLSSTCLARDKTQHLRVRCSIPAIPGINAPEDTESDRDQDKEEKKESETLRIRETRAFAMQQEERNTCENSQILITSFYAR